MKTTKGKNQDKSVDCDILQADIVKNYLIFVELFNHLIANKTNAIIIV